VFRLDRHVRRLTTRRILGLRPRRRRRNWKARSSSSPAPERHVTTYVRPILVFANSNELPRPSSTPRRARRRSSLPAARQYLSAASDRRACRRWRRVETAIPARAKATGAYLNSALARREAVG
jgi:branched-subunit amino acid aminotransferase/4-amino-4-deoxychorismate lyase